jgi:hypothetical protein
MDKTQDNTELRQGPNSRALLDGDGAVVGCTWGWGWERAFLFGLGGLEGDLGDVRKGRDIMGMMGGLLARGLFMDVRSNRSD